ncbi:hypothetical protein ABK040_011897 [Willaertia magna]
MKNLFSVVNKSIVNGSSSLWHNGNNRKFSKSERVQKARNDEVGAIVSKLFNIDKSNKEIIEKQEEEEEKQTTIIEEDANELAKNLQAKKEVSELISNIVSISKEKRKMEYAKFEESKKEEGSDNIFLKRQQPMKEKFIPSVNEDNYTYLSKKSISYDSSSFMDSIVNNNNQESNSFDFSSTISPNNTNSQNKLSADDDLLAYLRELRTKINHGSEKEDEDKLIDTEETLISEEFLEVDNANEEELGEHNNNGGTTLDFVNSLLNKKK